VTKCWKMFGLLSRYSLGEAYNVSQTSLSVGKKEEGLLKNGVRTLFPLSAFDLNFRHFEPKAAALWAFWWKNLTIGSVSSRRRDSS